MLELNGPTVRACHWDQPQCIEVAWRKRGWRHVIEITDSKLGSASPVHRMSLREWDRWLRAVHTWVPAADGMYRLGDLAFYLGEVRRFVDGADGGTFARQFATT
jgi:hypothetical protein